MALTAIHVANMSVLAPEPKRNVMAACISPKSHEGIENDVAKCQCCRHSLSMVISGLVSFKCGNPVYCDGGDPVYSVALDWCSHDVSALLRFLKK